MNMDKSIHYGIAISKVDKEHRLVSGFATLNNLDKQDEVVTTEASVKAFSEFRGNIREQHTKIAAGRMVSYGVEKFFDKVSDKVYDGIFVKAYISRGAQDTWEKVIDGTLSGFSIGGIIKDYDETETDDGRRIRIVKDYELTELSLVDNPANPLANVVAIEKMADYFSNIEKEQIMEEIEKADDVVEASTEVSETEVVAEEVAAVVEETPVDEPVVEATDDDGESDATMAEATESVVTTDADVLATAMADIKALLDEQKTSTTEAFNALITQLKDLQTNVSTSNTTITAVQEELAGVKSVVTEFDKRVDAVERDTAVRKSGDLGEVVQEEKIEKSIWGGRFLAADL
jgi:flagellin-like hook-associated protein FlgL